MEKPECKMIGEDSNVFNLIGITKKTLRRAKLYAELETFDAELVELTSSGGTYDDVLALIQKFVDPV